jgi:predicted dehydrogenase
MRRLSIGKASQFKAKPQGLCASITEIEAVVLATPHSLHADQITEILAAGR